MRKIIIILLLLLPLFGWAQQLNPKPSISASGQVNTLNIFNGGTQANIYLRVPLKYNCWAQYDSTGMIWLDSATKVLYYHNGTNRIAITGGGGSGTVTSIVTGFGLTGGNITTSGTINVNPSVIATKSALDSVAALITSGIDSATLADSTSAVKSWVLAQGYLDGGDTINLSNKINQKQSYPDTLTYDATRYWVSTQIPSLAGYVPYDGATGNVNLGEYYLRSGAFVFDTTPTGTPFDAYMYWDNVNKTPQVQLNGEVTLQIGQETHVRARNNTGITIPNGAAVYINGAQGSNPTIALADADSVSTAQVIGVATESIINNETGYVTISGVVNGVNTSGWNSGDKLYLSTNNGQLTNIAPSAPHISVLVGTALNSTNNGRIFVSPAQPIATDTLMNNGSNVPPTQYSVRSYVNSRGFGTGTIRALTGDVTASGTGTVTATLTTVNSSPGTYTYATVTVDNKGRTTFASSGTAPVTSVSGTAGRISSSGGTTPVVDLVTVNATPATYGSATAIPVVTVDAYGRATTITTTNPSVTTTNTATLTNKRIAYRTGGAASYTTSVTIPADSVDMFIITAQAGALLFNAPSGTPTEGQMLLIRIKDNGTARALTWNAIWRSGTTVTLPTTTTLSRTLYMEFLYNSTDARWDIVGVANGY
jgi:predicted RecA/RadA family phage recombinase